MDVDGNVTLIHEFNFVDGSQPLARPVEPSAGVFFGTTSAGGSGFSGTVFDMDGTGNLSTVCAFGSGDGLFPSDTLVEAPDGFLYGVTPYGGLFSQGTAFRLAAGGQLATIHSFRYPEGRFPYPSLTSFGSDLYGVTSCSLNGVSFGTAFKLDLLGNFTLLHTFSDSGSDGDCPSALVEGPDGYLYGTTALFGDCINGTVYRLESDGSVTPIYQSCDSPAGPLLSASDGLMYGVAGLGGGPGLIFRTTTTGDYSTFFSFGYGSPAGRDPAPRLVEGPGGLYGVSDGGIFNQGSVFRLTPGGHASALHFFGVTAPPELNGKSGLILASDGNFYGTTPGNGIDNRGSIYRINIYGDFATVHLFQGSDGDLATGLMEASDGNLYGITPQGGDSWGVAYRLLFGTQPISLSPPSGSALGGTSVTVSGRGFQSGASVGVGGAPAVNVIVSDPTQLTASTPTLFPGTLNDVVVTNPDASAGTLVNGWFADFLDVPQLDSFHPFVEKIFRHHVTAGYGNGLFGRNDPLTRAQMAVLLLKASIGPAFVPLPCGTNFFFADVPCDAFAADWINALYFEGITGGCGTDPLIYCPDSPVTRAQMAVFLLKAEHGSGYTAPLCAGIFQDVACSPTPAFAVDWIEQLYQEGVTGGCATNPLVYCPNVPVTRGQMAVLLVRTFTLP